MPVNFINLNPRFSNRKKLKFWISKTAESYGFIINQINYSFISCDEILEINKKYLSHNYLTDIISFDLSEEENYIIADIVICPSVVKTNAQEFGTSYQNEMHRVIIHGLLHLVGFNDSDPAQSSDMKNAEDNALADLQIILASPYIL